MSYNSMIRTRVVNHERAMAYGMSAEMELYSAVVTSLISDKYYEKNTKRMDRIATLVEQVDPLFVAQLAIYAREEMYLRSIPLFLIVQLARVHNGDNLVSRTIERVVKRVDDIMELLACYQMCNANEDAGKKLNRLSRQIQNGLKCAFNNFDEYQFAKYDNRNLEVKLRDALFLVHPKAKDANQQKIFNKIVDEELQIPYTWETELSRIGSQKYDTPADKVAAKRECWTRLIKSGRLGYMALLRNLRNIIEVGVDDDTLSEVCSILASAHKVAQAKQLPYRYLSAFYSICKIEKPAVAKVIDALERAVSYSVDNLVGFDAKTSVLLACDVSGSMIMKVSAQSNVMLYDIGVLMASVLRTKCRKVITGIFGTDWMPVEGDTNTPVLQYAMDMYSYSNKVGFATNGYKVINWLLENNQKVDKLMFFTDMQMWCSDHSDEHIEKSWKRYKQRYPQAKLYLFDLNGYGMPPIQVPDKDVMLLAGWSDGVFEMIEAYENGKNIIGNIKNIVI